MAGPGQGRPCKPSQSIPKVNEKAWRNGNRGVMCYVHLGTPSGCSLPEIRWKQETGEKGSRDRAVAVVQTREASGGPDGAVAETAEAQGPEKGDKGSERDVRGRLEMAEELGIIRKS